MLRRVRMFLLLAAFPATVGATLILRDGGALGVAAAGYGVMVCAVAVFCFRTRQEVGAIARAAAERERGLSARRSELQTRLDFLTAQREISLVLNEDVDFQAVLGRVLEITCDTFGADVELWMPEGTKLVLRAARAGGKTDFGVGTREDRRVRQCFDDGRLVFVAEENRLHALAPLQANREIIGVVRLTSPLESDAAVRRERMDTLARHLEEFSKFLALALKTPDLYTRAVQDGLTGLWTKRHFMSQSILELDAARRYGEPLSLIMVDVDHFKKVNDTHGHAAGDRVLQGIAAILKRGVRGGGVFRYGGEEMAVLLPKADSARAVEVAERLRRSIESRRVGGVKVTASFGVAEIDASTAGVEALVEKADAALYRAKESGRNRVVVAGATAAIRATSRRFPRTA